MQKAKKGAKATRARNKNVASMPALVAALKMREACQYLGGIHSATMRRLIERGLIVPNRKLRHLTFSIEELDRFLKEGV
jgi:hypothetical protein